MGTAIIRPLTVAVMLALLSPEDDRASTVRPATRELEFTYGAVVRNIPAASRRLQIWVPIPYDDACQTISDLQIVTPLPYRQMEDTEYGNVAIYIEASSDLPDSLPLQMTFRARRCEARPITDTAGKTGGRIQRFLSPDVLVPIDGQIAAEAMRVTDGLLSDSARARVLYAHILQSMRYDKTGSGWGRGDAIFACSERRGNCTDIHSLLIGMARATKIPARFVIGFPIPPNSAGGAIGGYHCWADLYIEGLGWVPVDASEAITHPDQTDYFFGTLDPNRVAFTIGRDIRLGDDRDAPKINYFIYPYVLVDGHEFTDVTHQFAFRVLDDSTNAR